MDSKPTGSDLRDGMPFLGGHLWLDLLNSTPILAGIEQDLLATPEQFARWLVAAGLPLPEQSAADQARRTLVALRQRLRAAFDEMRATGAVSKTAAYAVNLLLAQARIELRLEVTANGAQLVETFEPGAGGPAATVAQDFARFAATHPAAQHRLKGCANPACNMVFFDSGKNATRRWCSMALCGNREKIKRYRKRKATP
ncbi:MAG: CGNR zinc finger domain-containing protein [Rhodospirillales bacterium]|jgi:predicted RNA-binding Zn ribbon-like protein